MQSAGGSGSGSVVSAQEQASADLVLLQQELGKSKRVTGRMTALLTSCDDRLARLDKAVVPIHRSTKDLGKIQRNIEAALLAIDAVLGTNDLVDREQEIIDRNQPRDDLPAYQASLTRLKQAFESMQRSDAATSATSTSTSMSSRKGKEREGTLGRVKALIETGCRKVGDVFLDLVLDASPKQGWSDIGSWEQGEPFPDLMSEATIRRLAALLGFIQSILGQNSPVEQDLQQGYGDIRGMYMATTLNNVGREAIDGVEVQTKSGSSGGGRIPAFGRRGFGRFLDAMFAMARSEHGLAASIFGKHLANQVYLHAIPPTLTILTATATAINGSVKRTLTSNAASVGIAFTCYADLTMPYRVDTFEDWIRSKSGTKENVLNQLSHAFRGSCMRSLPEFLEETKAYGTKALGQQDQTNARISPISINAIEFAKQICEFPEAVEQFLQTLGEGNWMPAGHKSSGSAASGSEFALTSRYLADIIQTLLTALESRARLISNSRMKDPSGLHASGSVLRKDRNDHHAAPGSGQRFASGVAAVFMLNNVSYIRRELLLNSNVPDLLASSGGSRRDSSSTTATGAGAASGSTSDINIEDELNKRNRQAKTRYLEIFSPLVSCLMDAGVEQSVLKSAIGVGNTEKKDTKDRFGRFNEALEEVESLHKVARLDKNEQNLRERVKDEVIRMCVPTYTRFVQKHENFSKNTSKYLKTDPAAFEARLSALFE